MKKLFALPALLLLGTALFAQNMAVKKFNTTSFKPDVRSVSELLSQKSSAEAKQHPEYGILPYNSQCLECVELIDKRTIDSRFFINPVDENHSFSQKSYFPMHYKKSAADIWRTIDPRLREKAPGVYVAENQPVPAKLDLNRKLTSLTERGFEFEFNKQLTMYFFDDNSLYTAKESGNYTNHTVGEEGLYVKNMWAGIDMEQLFTAGQVKTNYIISAPLQLPVSHGWMVIEDHFTLPAGLSVVPTGTDNLPDGLYRGSYAIKNEKGETLITYDKPVYIDAKVLGMNGVYKLLQNGNNYTLQMYVPVEWLNKADNTYPLMLDPNVYGLTKLGDFTQSGFPSASMGFTSMNLGSCDYHMNVTVPGKSTIINSYVDAEYTLTYDNTCGTPALPPPFCTFNMVDMEVRCDSCNTSTGLLSCNPANPPYTGTCTTDSNLVPAAHAIQSATLVPSTCYTPQCPDYQISFTLRNRDSICGDVCGYLCARGNMWRMAVEATIEPQYAGIPVTSHNDTLFSSIPTGNQWYRNDTLIPGATDSFFVATQEGSYYTIIDTFFCTNPAYFSLNCAAQFYILNKDSFPDLFGIDSGYYYATNESFGFNLNYLWEFGDGDTSTSPYPTHDYATPGQYNVCLTVSSATPGCSDTHCDSSFYVYKTSDGLMTKFIVLGPTGIDEVNKQIAGIKLYPNPATNELNIYSNGLPLEKVRLFSIDGRLVLDTQKATNKIDISHLAKGAYIAEVILQKGAKKIRWVKL